MAGPATRVLRTTVPGSSRPGSRTRHTHFIHGGIQLAQHRSPSRATSPEDFNSRIKAYASERKPGEWILGGEWDHERWPGAPLPHPPWIDSVTPDNPVFVYRLDRHMALANTAALR